MSLRTERVAFTRDLARLVDRAFYLGYEVALGEVSRDQRVAVLNAQSGKGIVNSLHLIGLAADLNLYRNGVYLSRTEDHAELGAFWKSLDQLNRWGGDFKNKQDGNHYSRSWEGRA